jgi:hypothetical protein
MPKLKTIDIKTGTPQPETVATPAPDDVLAMPRVLQIRAFINQTWDIRFNELTLDIEYRPRGNGEFVLLDDLAQNDMIIRIKSQGFNRPKDDVNEILHSSNSTRYNPVDAWFATLKWDKADHIARLAKTVKLTELDLPFNYERAFAELLRKWLMAATLCMIGRKHNDVMLMLIGEQGKFKTTWLNNLCPPGLLKYLVCGHITPSLTDYNTANYLAERVILNIDDQMETIFGRDFNQMKAIISVPDVTNRKLYARTHRKRRRVANFVGSVNNPQILTDTQNRRYLCFFADDIDIEATNQIDMSQVWAQAWEEAQALKSIYIFGREEYRTIEILNASFIAPSEEDEMLIRLYRPAGPDDDPDQVLYLQSAEILEHIQKISGMKNLKLSRLSRALKRNRFPYRGHKLPRFNYQSRYVYECMPNMEEHSTGSRHGVHFIDFRKPVKTLEPNF